MKAKIALLGAALGLMAVSTARAQQYPVLDSVANRVVERYQSSSCEQLMAARFQPKGPEEQHAIQMLHDDPQMQHEFLRRVAAPIANKLFECHMIP